MVKSQVKKSKKTSPPSSRISLNDAKAHPIVALLLAVLLVGAIYLAYHQYDLNKKHQVEKKQFAALETQMQKVVANVFIVGGTPYESARSSKCGYVALKYARGDLNCGIVHRFDYEVDNVLQGKDLTIKVLNAFSNASPSPGLKNYNESTVRSGSGEGDTFYFDASGFSCSLSYGITSKQLHNSTLNSIVNAFDKVIRTPYATHFSYQCNKSVVKPLYEFEHTNY